MRQFHPFNKREARLIKEALDTIRIIVRGLECELRSAREQLAACEKKRSRTLAAARQTGEARSILASAEDCQQKAIDARYALSSLRVYAEMHARESRKEQLTAGEAPAIGCIQPIEINSEADAAT